MNLTNRRIFPCLSFFLIRSIFSVQPGVVGLNEIGHTKGNSKTLIAQKRPFSWWLIPSESRKVTRSAGCGIKCVTVIQNLNVDPTVKG